MMSKKIVSLVCMGALAMASTAFAKDLRVGSNTTFPPFEFVNSQTQEVTGFEMDLIRAMGEKAGYDVKIQNMGFDGIIPALMTGTVDVGASGFSITEERQKRVLFTDAFYRSGLTILVAKNMTGDIKGFDDLKGKRLAVQIGTTAATKAKTIEGADVRTFNNAGEAILELVNGGVDAVINDKPVTSFILTKQPRLAKRVVQLPDMLTADDFAMVVAKDNAPLQKELNDALSAMKASGEYQALYTKWFGNN